MRSIVACNKALSVDRKRREKQALAFAKIERSGHSQQPDTKCQMQGISAKARLLSVDASLLRVNSLAPLLNESLFLRQAKRTSENACPFCLIYYVRGIRTRALRKRHGASFLAAARRLLQSIKTADQGCFAKDKNESLFLRHKKPDIFCRVFCCFGRGIPTQ